MKYLSKFIPAFALCIVLLILSTVKVYTEPLTNTGVPAGFTIDEYATGFDQAVVAQYTDDGRIFVAQKDGTVKIYKDGQILPEPFYTVPNVNNFVDRGLLGMALHPNFPETPYVYLLYTYDNNPSHIAGPKTGRLVRVTANGDKAVPGSEVTLLGTNVGDSVKTSCEDWPTTSDCLPADSYSHAPGTVAFAPDGKLFVTVGDGAEYEHLDRKALRAQNLNSLAGKVLRINEDGTAPTDNPYFDGNANSNISKVWASGVRNAFRLGVRESDGLPLVGDVGWNYWEEINVVAKGANLGWPCYEGLEQQNGDGRPETKAYKNEPECQAMYANTPASLTYPIYQYPHPPSSAIVGGLFYTGNSYPAEYQNTYFFADYSKNQIYTLQLDSSNKLVPNSVKTFASNVNGPVQFFKGPNGDLFYIGIYTGSIYRIDYSSGNKSPIAIVSSDKNSGGNPLTVAFSSAGTTDPENNPMTFEWNFNDGTEVSTEANPTHTFTEPGTYKVQLRVTDSFNNQALAYRDIIVGQTAPNVIINSPIDKTKYKPGDLVTFEGTATDTQDGIIEGSKMRWDMVLQHCPLSDCHSHTVLSTTGSNGTFEFLNHDGPYYIEVNLTVTNSAGLTTKKQVAVHPEGAEINSAPEIDGVNDSITAQNSQDFKLQEFTIDAWFKSLTVDTWGSEIISMGNNWGIRLLGDGNIRFFFNSIGGWQNYETIGLALLDGVWHHVTVTKALGETKIYTDGILRATFSNIGQVLYNYGNILTIGRHGDMDDNFSFNGQVDEIRIWNYVRPQEEILNNYNKKINSDLPGLLAHYTFEEGNGNTSADLTGNNHDLSLNNGVIWRTGIPLTAQDAPQTPKNPDVLTLTDSFGDTTIDPTKWGIFNGANVNENGTLNINPTPNAVGYYGIYSHAKYSLKDSSLFIEAKEVPNLATTTELQLILQKDVNNLFIIGTTNGALMTRQKVSGVNTDTYTSWNAETMKYWRIREELGNIYLETSADKAVWTIRATMPTPFAVDEMSIVLQAGTWQPVGNPGIGKFANLNIVDGGTTPTPAPTETPTPTPTTKPAPVITSENTGITFDGVDDQVSIKHNGAFNLNSFSLETWFRADAVGPLGGEILTNGGKYGLRLLPDGNLRFYIQTGSMLWRNFDTTGLNLLNGNWYIASVTMQLNQIKLYINGVLQATFANENTIVYTEEDTILLGSQSGNNQHNFSGDIDEVRIFNKVLSDAEIAAHYKYEYWPSVPPELLGYWKFNEKQGMEGFNSAPITAPAKLLNGATWVNGYPRN